MTESPSASPAQSGDATSHLDTLHHAAIVVQDVGAAVKWYRDRFRCEIAYEDATWAMLRFDNANLALVTEGDHPPHCGFIVDDAARHGELKEHRDGTKSIYIPGPDGNVVELFEDNEAIRSL